MDSIFKSLMSDPGAIFLVGKQAVISYLVLTVLSLIICFLGLRLIRVWNALVGLVVGASIGLILSWVTRLDMPMVLVVTGAAAVIVAILAGVFKRFGVFLFCIFSITAVVLGMIHSAHVVVIAVCGAVALIVAILAMVWFEPLVIMVTALSGGFGLGRTVVSMVGVNNIYITLAVGALFSIVGMGIQFIAKSKEIEKREKKLTEEMKKEFSKEEVVEQARAILNLDEEEEED